MRLEIMPFGVLFCILFAIFPSSFGYETLNCSPLNLSVDITANQKINIKSPVVNFTYNRDGLAIYLYPGTPSVNLYLNDTRISTKGNFVFDGLDASPTKTYEIEVFGVANIGNLSEHNVGLRDCEFFIADKKTGGFLNELPLSVDSTVFRQVQQCISGKLCQFLGTVRNDDFTRARMEPRDFGPMSIWSSSLHTNFPKMTAPQVPDNLNIKKKSNMLEAADSIIREVAKKLYLEKKGMIDIPDVHKTFITASKGTFAGLENLQRAERIEMIVSPPTENPMTFSFTFGIPESHVVYEDYKAMRFMPFVGSLCANVQDLLFTVVVSMDFSGQYCKPMVVDFTTHEPSKVETYTCGQLSNITNMVMKWFLDVWNTDIKSSVEMEVAYAVASYVYEKFDCENFRPKPSMKRAYEPAYDRAYY